MRFRNTITALLLAAGASAYGQSQYAGQERREIKALSAEEVNGYLNGAGSGYAKAAELNHYPGPSHLLDLADQIRLTADQRTHARNLLDAHRQEARALGAKVVEAERELEALFRRGGIDEQELAQAVTRAAAAEGRYRLSHLETHRRLRALLTVEQVARYDLLRGYSSAAKPSGHAH